MRVSPSEAKTKKPRQLSYKAEFITLSLIVAIAALIGLNYSVMKAALDHTTPLSLAALRNQRRGSVPTCFCFVQERKISS